METAEIQARLTQCLADADGIDGAADCLEAFGRARRLRSGEAARAAVGRDQLYFIASGAAKLVAQASDGTEQVIGFHFAGEFSTVPAQSQQVYTLRALRDSEVLAFSTQEAIAAARGSPDMLALLLERTFGALHRCLGQAVLLGRRSAEERVAGFLMTLAGWLGRNADMAIVLELPMTRRDMADFLGLTVETISRQISAMRQMGVIATPSRAQIRILDRAQLSALAGHFAIAA